MNKLLVGGVAGAAIIAAMVMAAIGGVIVGYDVGYDDGLIDMEREYVEMLMLATEEIERLDALVISQ